MAKPLEHREAAGARAPQAQRRGDRGRGRRGARTSPRRPSASTSTRSSSGVSSSGASPLASRAGRGRSPIEWVLTPEAGSQFADRHGQLTVELLDAIRDALGTDGLDRVIDSPGRAAARGVPSRRARGRAPRRSSSGCARSRGSARPRATWPMCIATATASCSSSTTARSAPRRPRVPGFCRSELELFRDTLGPDVTVERTAHILAGDVRCAYLIRPSAVTTKAPVAVS